MAEADTYTRLSSGTLMEALIRRTLMEDDTHVDRNLTSNGGGSAFKRWKQRAMNDQPIENTHNSNSDNARNVKSFFLQSADTGQKKDCQCRIKCECNQLCPSRNVSSEYSHCDLKNTVTVKQELLSSAEIDSLSTSDELQRKNSREINDRLHWQPVDAISVTSGSNNSVNRRQTSNRDGAKIPSGAGLLLRALTEQSSHDDMPNQNVHEPPKLKQGPFENKQKESSHGFSENTLVTNTSGTSVSKQVPHTIPKKRTRGPGKPKSNLKYLKEPPPGYYDEWLKNIGLLKESRPRSTNENSPVGSPTTGTSPTPNEHEDINSSCESIDDRGRNLTMEMTIATMIERTLDASMNPRHNANKSKTSNNNSSEQCDPHGDVLDDTRTHQSSRDDLMTASEVSSRQQHVPKRRFFGVGKHIKKPIQIPDNETDESNFSKQGGILRHALGNNPAFLETKQSERLLPSSNLLKTSVSKISEHNAYEFSDEASLQTECNMFTKFKTESAETSDTCYKSQEAEIRSQIFIKTEKECCDVSQGMKDSENGEPKDNNSRLSDCRSPVENSKSSAYFHSSGSENGGRASPDTVDANQPQKKKKRKRCGTCEPCMTKENCGECSSCRNRRTGHQICKMRKCVLLRRKLAPLIAPLHVVEELEKKEFKEPAKEAVENAKAQKTTSTTESTVTTSSASAMNPQVPPQTTQQQLHNGHSHNNQHLWDPYHAAKGHPHATKQSYQHLFQQEFAHHDFRTTSSPAYQHNTQVTNHQLHNQVAHMQNERLTPNPQTDMRYLPQQAMLEPLQQKDNSSNLPPTKKMDIAHSLLSLHSGIRETSSVGSPDPGNNHNQSQMPGQIDSHNIPVKGNQWNMFDPSAMQQHSAQTVAKDNAAMSARTQNYHMQNGQQVPVSTAMDASQAGRYHQKLHRTHPYQQSNIDPNYRMHNTNTNSNKILSQNSSPNSEHRQLPGQVKNKFPQNYINRFHERFGEAGMNPIMSMEMLSKEMNHNTKERKQKNTGIVEQSMRKSAAMVTPEQPGKQHPCNTTPISMELPLNSASKTTATPYSGNNHMIFMDTPSVISSVEKLEQTKTKHSKSKSRSETPKLNSIMPSEPTPQLYGLPSDSRQIPKPPEKTKECLSAEIALKASLRHPRPIKKIESAHTLDPPKPLLTPLGPPVLNTRPSKMVTIVNPCNTPPRSPPPAKTAEEESKEEKSEEKTKTEIPTADEETELKKKRKSILETVEQEYEQWEVNKRLEEDAKVLPPDCNCGEVEKDDAPYYTHLGAGPSIKAIRKMMEERYGESGRAVRIEKLVYSGKEGKTELGCPIAKWIIRRSGKDEKMLVLVRHRFGHSCETAYIIIGIILWEGVKEDVSNNLYSMLSTILPKHGSPTVRRCGTNEEKTCACQGKEDESSGASFSFGCSWLMYYNGCKFARSKTPRKFKLDGSQEEEVVESELQNLATFLSPLYKQMAPVSYEHQIHFEKEGKECRIGYGKNRPFGGVTTCMDFCAHAHRDQQNMNNGCTVVVTLTKDEIRNIKPDPGDEQLHVLPLYYLDSTDEHGDPEGQRAKVQSGAIEVLTNFCNEVRLKPKDQIVPRGRGKRNKDTSSSDSPSKRAKASAQVAENEAKETSKKAAAEVVVKDEFKRMGPQHQFQLPNKHMQETNASAYNQHNHWQMGLNARQSDNIGMHVVNGIHPSLMAQQPHLGMAFPYEMYPQYPAFPQYFPIPALLGQEANMHSIHPGFQGHIPSVHLNHFMSTQAHIRPQFEDVKPDVRQLNAMMRQSEFQGAAVLHRQDTPSAMYGPHGQPIPQIDLTQHWNSSGMDHSARPAGFHAPVVSGFGLPGQQQPSTERNTQAIPHGPGGRGPVDQAQQAKQPGQQQNPSSIWRPPIEDKNTKNAASPSLPSQDSGNVSAANSKPGTVDLNAHTPKNMFGMPASPHVLQGQAASIGRPSSNQSTGTSASKDGAPSIYPQDMARSSDNGLPKPENQSANMQIFPDGQPSSRKSNSGSNPNIQGIPGHLHANQMQMHPTQTNVHPGQANLHPAQANLHAGQANLHSAEANLHRQQMAAQMQVMSGGHQLKPQDQSQSIKTLTPPSSDSESYITSNAHCFRDATIGGVAIALTHGSVLFEVAKRELHATTALHRPCRQHPSRISLVFYQHKHLNVRHHGMKEYEDKMMARHQEQEEAARLAGEETPTKGRRKAGKDSAKESNSSKNSSAKNGAEVPSKLADTLTTESLSNSAPELKCIVSGPYQKWSWGQTPQRT